MASIHSWSTLGRSFENCLHLVLKSFHLQRKLPETSFWSLKLGDLSHFCQWVEVKYGEPILMHTKFYYEVMTVWISILCYDSAMHCMSRILVVYLFIKISTHTHINTIYRSSNITRDESGQTVPISRRRRWICKKYVKCSSLERKLRGTGVEVALFQRIICGRLGWLSCQEKFKEEAYPQSREPK